MKTLLFLFLLLVPRQGCLKLDVILLVDSSSSVGSNRKFLNDAIEVFRGRFIGTDVNVGVVTFANKAVLRAHLGDSLRVNVYPGGNTNLLDGLQTSVSELFGSRGRNGVSKIIVLVTDGLPDDRHDCEVEMSKIRTIMNVEIFGIQVGIENRFLEDNCSVYMESDYEGLVDELKKLDVCL